MAFNVRLSATTFKFYYIFNYVMFSLSTTKGIINTVVICDNDEMKFNNHVVIIPELGFILI